MPELAHVLFLDIVACSQLPSDEQRRIAGRLQQLVRGSGEYQRAQEKAQVISLPTGDGMALVFFNKLDSAVLCAVEITRAIQAESLCQVRMGVNTGPVFVIEDINHKRNVSGAGINVAERVMSCGADGHILLSEHAAAPLGHLSAWRDKIQSIGDCKAKDGWIRVWNLVDGPIGNRSIPRKSRRYAQRRRMLIGAGVAALVLAVAGAVAGAFWLGQGAKTSQPVQDWRSIAVLPFIDLSPEKNQEYFSQGLAEELLSALAKIPRLRVTGPISSFQFKGKGEDSSTIGKKLGVATILEGSVRRQGGRARISVRLIRAEGGYQLWSETYDREMNDILAVEEDIAKAVTGTLKIKLLDSSGPSRAPKKRSERAYTAFLEGNYFRERGENAKAYTSLQVALKTDPTYPEAWAALGEVRQTQAGNGEVPMDEGYREARQAAEHALALDPTLELAHDVLGEIKMFRRDWAGADANFKQALELAPGDAGILRAAGSLAQYLGRLGAAESMYRKSIEIEPLYPNSYKNLALILYYQGRQEEARSAANKALDLLPQISFAHALLSQIDLAEGRWSEAADEAGKEKHSAFRMSRLSMAHHALGLRKQSDADLAGLKPDAAYQIAQAYAFRDEVDHALKWLETAYAVGDPGLNDMKPDPLLKGLRSDKRFQSLLVKMGLPAQ